ncbi:MAG: GntR family transcriptional regulator [Proteobacteria bacterium]|nr:GntR family transcriptional regulator [Pseudomonadota bacterium]
MVDEEQTLRKGRFLREQVHKKLKESIINGILPPNKRLIEEKIAAEAEMSRTPVREAIQKLEKEGLIHKLPRGGYAVNVVTVEDVDDVFGLRSVIEGYAAYLATLRATGEDIAVLEEIVKKEEKNLKEKRYDEIIELNTTFHEKLYKIARSSKLYAMIYDLRDYIHRFRVIILSYQDFVEISINDHKDMIALMKVKDATRVEKLVRKHITRGKNLLKKRIKRGNVKHGSGKKGAAGG